MNKTLRKCTIVLMAVLLVASMMMVGYFFYMYNMAKYIEILGERYERNAEYLDLTDKSISPEEYDEIQNLLPDCEIIWMVPMGKNHVRSDATEISANDISVDALPLLVYLPNLKRVDTMGCDDYPVMVAIKTQYPDVEIEYTVQLVGVNVSSNDEFADISGIPVEDIDEFTEKIGYLPELKKIDMCNCGLTNDQFDVLIEAYPGVKFVWVIKFGKSGYSNWSCRTDILIFSALQHYDYCGPENEKDFAPLFKYCTDLVALDVGHNNIKDLSFVKNLKKLKLLIIAYGRITDLSPLEDLPDLEFLEFQRNFVEDISPLAKIKSLKWINLTWNPTKDLTPLYELPDLKKVKAVRLSFWLDKSMIEEMKANLPEGCSVILSNGRSINSPTPWRSGDVYWGYRMACANWKLVESMTGWDDVKYKDGYYVKFTKGRPETNLPNIPVY